MPPPDLRLLGPLAGRRVLLLGAGDGSLIVDLAAEGSHVITVDPSAERLVEVRRRLGSDPIDVELHHADFADLAFIRADTVDSALSLAVGSVGDLDRLFRQVHRVLKAESPLLCSLPHPAADLVDPSGPEPLVIRRSYFERGVVGDHLHRPLADLFTSFTRANFRIDTLLEPEPDDSARSAAQLPATLVVRARKVGT